MLTFEVFMKSLYPYSVAFVGQVESVTGKIGAEDVCPWLNEKRENVYKRNSFAFCYLAVEIVKLRHLVGFADNVFVTTERFVDGDARFEIKLRLRRLGLYSVNDPFHPRSDFF